MREKISKICFYLKNFKSFCGKGDVFDCAGIRALVLLLPVNCSTKNYKKFGPDRRSLMFFI